MSWENDKLNRKEESKYLVSYIKRKYEANEETSLSINLNAIWGQGKTYFLSNLKEDLDENGHPVVYYDAWKNDYSNEALISFISEISEMLSDTLGVNRKVRSKIERFKESGKKLIKSSVPVILSAIVKHLLKTDIESLLSEDEDSEAEKKDKDEIEKDIADTISLLTSSAATSLFADHKATKNSIKDFRAALKGIVSELVKKEGKLKDKKLPIFVLVDELDRCRPTFAIELLEAIKHLFGVYGIVFISATNTKELQASVKAVYGSEFSSDIYLKRFFDLEYSFKKPDLEGFAELLFEDLEVGENVRTYVNIKNGDKKKSAIRLFAVFCEYFSVSLRDMEQIKTSLEACLYTQDDILEMPLLLFLLILKQRKFESVFQSFESFSAANKDTISGFFEKGGFKKDAFLTTKKEISPAQFRSNEKVTVREIINTYFMNKGKSIRDIQFVDHKLTMLSDIAIALRESLPTASKVGSPKVIGFEHYFQMVEQAGRFTSEVEKGQN